MTLRSEYDVIVIGAGPAGLAASVAARENGCYHVLVIDRDIEPGGILQQCVHNGFGLETFKEDLPGPAYAQRFVEMAVAAGVEFLMDCMVLDVTRNSQVTVTSEKSGLKRFQAKAVIFTMGCRERSRAQIRIPGTRPAGVFTAGTAQRWVNIDGFMPGNRFVILGSGDIGMIMARRLVLEGADVERVVEIMPYLSGLSRNLVQCLQDYDIPLFLNHTVSRIFGNRRVEAVEISAVDEQRNPIPGTAEMIECDTLLLSVGLIPENELTRKAGVRMDARIGGAIVDNTFSTSIPGFFVAGNVVHVYDLVDYVSHAGKRAGKSAADFIQGKWLTVPKTIQVGLGENVRYVIPQLIRPDTLKDEPVVMQLRVSAPLERPVEIVIQNQDEKEITKKRLPYARPGELITVTIPTSAYDLVAGSTSIQVSVI